MELRNLESYGEPGATVYRVDCVELMRLAPAESVDAIFADPPYRLSGGGLTVKSGCLAPVDKGDWIDPWGRPYALQRIFIHLRNLSWARHRRRQSESAHQTSDRARLYRMLDMV